MRQGSGYLWLGLMGWVLWNGTLAADEYRDLPTDHWAAEAVRQLTTEGILEGYPDGTFRGSQPMTRYEAAMMVQRLLQRLGVLPKPQEAQAGQVLRKRYFVSPTEKLELDLPKLIGIAVQENPEIQALLRRWEATQHTLKPAGTLPDPMFGVELSNLPLPSLTLNDSPMTGIQLRVAQLFPARGKLAAQEEMARQDIAIANLDYLDKIAEIIARVKGAFYDLYFIHHAIRITQANKGILEEFVKIAQTKYEVGQGLQQDVLKAQVELSKIVDDLLMWQQRLETAQARLNTLLNRPPQAPLGEPPEWKPEPLKLSLEQLQERALTYRPALRAIEHMIARLEARKRWLQRDLRPDFLVAFGYRFRESVPMDRTRGVDFWTLGVTMDLPLRAGNRQHEQIREVERLIERWQARYLDVRNRIFFAIRDQLAIVERAWKEVELFRDGIIPQAEMTLQSARAGYQVGKVDFLTLLDAQIKLYNWQIQYYKSLNEYGKQLANLEWMVGRPLTEEAEWEGLVPEEARAILETPPPAWETEQREETPPPPEGQPKEEPTQATEPPKRPIILRPRR